MVEIIIVSLVGVALIALTILSQAELWQRKEYRFDRMLAFVQSDEWMQSFIWLLLAIVILSNAGWYAFFIGSPLAEPIGWLLLSVLAFFHVQRTATRGLFRPRLTAKSALLVTAMGVVAVAMVSFTYVPYVVAPLQWATLVWLMPVVAAPCVWLVNALTGVRKKQIINRAKQVRKKLADLSVIGITGSYGKTSTKYFLAQILSSAKCQYMVTDEHRNSELAVAQDMLNSLTNKTDIYVVEMGAYRVGEIDALVQLTKPSVGIVTAIGNQHVALFGSRQQLAKAKWELVRGLPKDGTAILNADDETVSRLGAKVSKNVLWYSSQRKADVYVTRLEIKGCSFTGTFYIGGLRKRVTVPLASEAMLSSVLAAMAGARALGVSAKDVFTALSDLKPMAQTMEVRSGKKGSVVIDDSYSANEFGMVTALNHLKRFDGNKLVVMVPIIELGTESRRVHERIGRALSETDAQIFVYGTAYSEAIKKGLGKKQPADKVMFFSQPDELIGRVKESVEPGTTILLEGRLPSVVRQELLALAR